MCWPEYDESVWDRKARESNMVREAIEEDRANRS
jgi:hypothetical protein